MLEKLLYNITYNKIGVEIGGPSGTGRLIYTATKQLDNVIFSKATIWSKHTDVYSFYPGKTGRVIINDATDIHDISDETYDYVFASHCLEHIANPLKAVCEWKRITKPDGYLILILPEKSHCFDHKRSISKFSVLLQQYEKNVGEDDLSTLPEILELHDLAMDPPAGTLEQFKARSLDNVNNRCLHHYVYSPELLEEVCKWAACSPVYTITKGLDIWFIMKKIAGFI
jgi:hypothetical protein